MIGTIIGIGIATLVGAKIVKNKVEDNKRRNIECTFSDGISEDEFEEIVLYEARHIKRITNVRVIGPYIYGSVRSQSGISSWDFNLDFNDYGHITGTFWSSSGNNDSEIPKILGRRIQASLSEYL